MLCQCLLHSIDFQGCNSTIWGFNFLQIFINKSNFHLCEGQNYQHGLHRNYQLGHHQTYQHVLHHLKPKHPPILMKATRVKRVRMMEEQAEFQSIASTANCPNKIARMNPMMMSIIVMMTCLWRVQKLRHLNQELIAELAQEGQKKCFELLLIICHPSCDTIDFTDIPFIFLHRRF